MALDYEKCKKLMLERWSKFCDDLTNKNDSEIIADLCSSIIAEESEVLKDEPICYQYKDGDCFFILDGIEFIVADLRGMRKSERTHTECYFDVCTLVISFKDTDGIFKNDLIPDAWLYGSTSDDFNEGNPVNDFFIEVARKYIEEHHITKEMQEVEDDD